MIAAVILAAGKSERMGSAKALLPYGGHTFLDRILASIDECGISHRVIVAGAHFREIAAHAPSLRVVFNPDYDMGMTTSFQAGIRALPEGVDGAIVFLVDHPLISPGTIRALLAAGGAAEVILPVYKGRRGHPVLFSRRFLDEILELPASVGVNHLVRSRPERVAEVVVNDPGVLVDIDTPDDLERLGSGEASTGKNAPGESRSEG